MSALRPADPIARARSCEPNRLLVPGLSAAHDGEGGIRTLDERITTRNALAGRRLQPLGHLSRSLRISDAPTGSRSPLPTTRLPLASHGGVPERSNGAVSKTVRGASSSRVQIPPPPLHNLIEAHTPRSVNRLLSSVPWMSLRANVATYDLFRATVKPRILTLIVQSASSGVAC
jgi:hypothetical protein